MLRALAVLLLLLGLAMAVPGVWLVSLGGSPYFLLAGTGMVAAAERVLRHRAVAGVALYAVVVTATAVWSLWEIDAKGWMPVWGADLAGRGGLLLALLLLMTVPLWLTLPQRGSPPRREPRTGRSQRRLHPPVLAVLALLGLAIGAAAGLTHWRLAPAQSLGPPSARGAPPALLVSQNARRLPADTTRWQTEAHVFGLTPIDALMCRIRFRQMALDGLHAPSGQTPHSRLLPPWTNAGPGRGGSGRAAQPELELLVMRHSVPPDVWLPDPHTGLPQTGVWHRAPVESGLSMFDLPCIAPPRDDLDLTQLRSASPAQASGLAGHGLLDPGSLNKAT